MGKLRPPGTEHGTDSRSLRGGENSEFSSSPLGVGARSLRSTTGPSSVPLRSLCPICGEFTSHFDSELSMSSGQSTDAQPQAGGSSTLLMRGAARRLLPVCCHACRVMLREAGHASGRVLSLVGHYGAHSEAEA